jgi:RNA polymerase sigma factor (sigma-70 family)
VGTLMMRKRRSGHSDEALIERARRDDLEAYGLLFERHRASATALARKLSGGSAGEADDTVSEAFERVLGALRRGSGPRDSFRPYLLTAVRRTAYDRTRRESRVGATDQDWILDEGFEDVDPSVLAFERGAIADAYKSLPERWQAVLWHTEIEETPVEELSIMFDMKPNAVAALAYRAREGLRQAYVLAHVDIDLTANEPVCRWTVDHLPKYLRGKLNNDFTVQVDNHLLECDDCRISFAEMAEVGLGLRAMAGPLLLAPGAFALGTGAAGIGGGLVGAAKLAGLSAGSASAAGATGVATAGVIGAGAAVSTGAAAGSVTVMASVAAATVAATVGGAFVLPAFEPGPYSASPPAIAAAVDWAEPSLDVVDLTVPSGAAQATDDPSNSTPDSTEAPATTVDAIISIPSTELVEGDIGEPLVIERKDRPVGDIGDALVITPPLPDTPKPRPTAPTPGTEPEIGEEEPLLVTIPTPPEATVPESTVPETTVPESTVPESTVPETEMTVPDTGVQGAYEQADAEQ